MELRGGILNVGTVTLNAGEQVDMMKRKKVVQETRWKGSKAKSLGVEFYLFCHGGDEKCRRSHHDVVPKDGER